MVITTWSPIHLRAKLKEFYRKNGQNAAKAAGFFEDTWSQKPVTTASAPATLKPKPFHGSAEAPAATAKMRLVQIAEEIVSVLTSDPNAPVRLWWKSRPSFQMEPATA